MYFCLDPGFLVSNCFVDCNNVLISVNSKPLEDERNVIDQNTRTITAKLYKFAFIDATVFISSK